MELVEKFLTEKGGLGAFGALLILKVGEMVWHYIQSRDANLKSLQCAVEKNHKTLVAIQHDLKRFKIDLRRAFHALKKVSGDDWHEIAEEIETKFKHEGETNGT